MGALNGISYDEYLSLKKTAEKGEIVLWIEHDGVSSTFVMLAYKDKINGNVIKNHAIDDL